MGRNALGKGLGALIRPLEPATEVSTSTPVAESEPSATDVDIGLIDQNPNQPRTQFREDALNELAQSIRSAGIVQPLVLRKNGARYQLIAGERRWRAALLAGLKRVPAVVRDVPEVQALEMALIENIQREDLSPIDQAKAFQRLTEQFGLTQEEVAVRTGKDRTTVSNTLRLLNLDQKIQQLIDEGRLSAGHGRALLGVEDSHLRQTLAARAVRGGMNVRQIEKFGVRRRNRKVVPPTTEDPNIKAAIEELQRTLGTRVILRARRAGRPGLLGIEYYDDQQLIALYDRLLGR